MGIKSDLEAEVKTIFADKWEPRDGQKVPEPEDLTLGNTAINSPWCKSVNSRPSEIGFWFGDRIWMRREAGRFGVSLRSRADFGR